MANKILESSSNELAVPKSSISGLPRVKRQSLSPGTAAFCSLGLLTFQESWANGTLGRTKVKLVNGPVNGPTLAPALHTPCWGTWAKLKSCISISEAPVLSTRFAFGSGRYFFHLLQRAMMYFAGWMPWFIIQWTPLDFCNFSTKSLTANSKGRYMSLRLNQGTNFLFYRFLSFPCCRGMRRRTFPYSFATGSN